MSYEYLFLPLMRISICAALVITTVSSTPPEGINSERDQSLRSTEQALATLLLSGQRRTFKPVMQFAPLLHQFPIAKRRPFGSTKGYTSSYVMLSFICGALLTFGGYHLYGHYIYGIELNDVAQSWRDFNATVWPLLFSVGIVSSTATWLFNVIRQIIEDRHEPERTALNALEHEIRILRKLVAPELSSKHVDVHVDSPEMPRPVGMINRNMGYRTMREIGFELWRAGLTQSQVITMLRSLLQLLPKVRWLEVDPYDDPQGTGILSYNLKEGFAPDFDEMNKIYEALTDLRKHKWQPRNADQAKLMRDIEAARHRSGASSTEFNRTLGNIGILIFGVFTSGAAISYYLHSSSTRFSYRASPDAIELRAAA